ncbi:MAG: hypothetical protein KF900_14105 [Bacteroidetes bacterium]|nr:hypothetical protein [Bacteroidota bacterium]
MIKPKNMVQLAVVYGVKPTTMRAWLRPFKKRMITMRTKIYGKPISTYALNSRQLNYIVSKIGNPPLYSWNGRMFLEDIIE